MDIQNLLIVAVIVVVLALVLVAFVVRRRRPTREAGPRPGRLAKTSSALGAALRGAWATGLDSRTWDHLEEALIAADVGVDSSVDVVAAVKASKPDTVEEAKEILADQLVAQLAWGERELHLQGKPAVILVVGVNGTGKTTAIARLGHRLQAEGMSVVFAAADTFRAAAGAQLDEWGARLGVRVVGGADGGDPASVVYDAIDSARSSGADVVIVDTAGRLHAKKNLMAELEKIHRVADREQGVDEVLLVLDATGGQNGLNQVKEFAQTIPVSGIVLTKLDGTAKGGIVIAVERQFDVPVKFVGVGEGLADLEPFEPNNFVAELLEQA